MSRTATFAIFFAVVTTLVVLIHYYFWTRLVRDTAMQGAMRVTLTGLLISLGVSLPLSFVLMRSLSPDAARLLTFPIYVWMGLLFLIFLLLLGVDLVRVGLWVGRRMTQHTEPLDPGRRVLLARAIAGTTLLASMGAAGFAVYNALTRLVTRRLQIKLRRLPRTLDGFTLVQLTDLHVGPVLQREWLEQVVRRVNALKPDLIAITGDLVDGSVEQLAHEVEPLRQLRARRGIFFVTGNHEYYSGAPQWIAHLQQMGIRVLRNERVSIGEGAASFDLAGVDDHHGGRMLPDHGPDVDRAVKGRDPQRELVLLAHQPKAIFDAARVGVGLLLSGHTHGGQIWPMGQLARLQQPYIKGLSLHGPTQIYVSQGTGFWGPPMRLGTTCEITHVTLRCAEA